MHILRIVKALINQKSTLFLKVFLRVLFEMEHLFEKDYLTIKKSYH